MPTLHHLQTALAVAELVRATPKPLTTREIHSRLNTTWADTPGLVMFDWCANAMWEDGLMEHDDVGHVILTARGTQLAQQGLGFFFRGH